MQKTLDSLNELKLLLKEHNVVQHGEFKLASGKQSKYYLDVKNALLHWDVLIRAAREINDRATICDVVAGIEPGSVPLATAITIETHSPLAIVRKRVPEHGLGKEVLGDVLSKRVLLVEDVTTTGESALSAYHKLFKAGAIYVQIYAIVDREEGARDLFEEHGIRYESLFKVRDLMD